jgi:hypothetical protein
MLELTPRIYSQNMTWKIAPNNIIDTVKSQPILNTPDKNLNTLKSLTYKQAAFPHLNNNIYDLSYSAKNKLHPRIPDDPKYFYIDIAYSNLTNDYRNNYIAVGRTEIYRCTIDDEITLDQPVKGELTVEVQLQGSSYYRQSKYELYRSHDQALKRFTNALDPEISLWDSNKGIYYFTHLPYIENTLHYIYNQSSNLMCTPFISTQGIYTGRVIDSEADDRQESDYLSAWVSTKSDSLFDQEATTDSWQQVIYDKGVQQTPSDDDKKLFYPYVYNDIDTSKYPNTPAKLYEDIQPLVQVTLTDTDNPLKKQIHIDFIYYMGGTYRAGYTILDLPSLIQATDILDFITSVTVNIKGYKYSTDTEDKDYSLDSAGNLTTENLKNTYAYNINSNELITSETTINKVIWDKAISQLLLDKYKNGKYIVKAQVPAQWALANNVHINTQMYVKTLNGEYISRKGVNCIFEVKIIKKHFESSQFYYELQLMEV